MPTPPRTLAQFDERPRIVVRPDGTLLGASVLYTNDGPQLQARHSTDGGATWSAAERLLALPDGNGAWGGCQALATDDGEVHAFLLNDAGTDVLPVPGRERHPAPLLQRRLDVWHARTDGRGSRWRAPVRIWEGYTGSLNSVLQTRSGRVLLPFAYLTQRTWRDRGEGLDAFWYAGQNSSTVLYSDDGESWHLSGAELKTQTPSIGTYGAVEPVVVERADGRLWMLARTQLGRFYESFSDDGSSWSRLQPSPLISSDSPAGLVRLSDGRLVLLWNKCRRFPYAHGGRHVLHAAISEDDGGSWIGHREVARDPRRYEPPPPGGDHGTAYPFPVVLPDDTVLVTTGQGAGRVVVVAIDPEWLYEKSQVAAFEIDAGAASPELPDEWSAFGCRGVGVRDEAGVGGVLDIARTHEEWPAAAVWNHPLGRRGRLALRVRLNLGSGGARVLLSDHFSVPFDPEAALEALFAVRLVSSAEALFPEGSQVAVRGEPSLVLEAGRWHDVQIHWDLDDAGARAVVAQGSPSRLPQRHISDGVCYLRLTPVSSGIDPGFSVAAARVDID